jgi:arabinogalactan endo-1,4-beta-galactosidase
MKVWLTVHYSDSWADPGQQSLPGDWSGISFAALKDSVYEYTAKIIAEIHPDYIQIGNEINNGFLWPHGRVPEQAGQFLDLLSAGTRAVRDHSDSTRIIIHYAGHENAVWFYGQLASTDYDLIGLSYYPWWHGKEPDSLRQVMIELKHTFDKGILIAETAYPFTLEWNDWTHNSVGLESQLILPEYPATPSGQKDFLFDLQDLIISANGIGLCYWGAEWIAYDGPQSTQGSGWENLALFDFNQQVQPGMQVFRK